MENEKKKYKIQNICHRRCGRCGTQRVIQRPEPDHHNSGSQINPVSARFPTIQISQMLQSLHLVCRSVVPVGVLPNPAISTPRQHPSNNSSSGISTYWYHGIHATELTVSQLSVLQPRIASNSLLMKFLIHPSHLYSSLFQNDHACDPG
jgi:hypothetical protein